ncbi:MAG: dihydrolipoyl dehydrogenase [Myxococcota bacterium]
MATKTIAVPDIGDFEDVEVIEVLVTPGQRIAREDPLVTLESDKASMDVPSPEAGVVREVLVAVESRVRQGTPLVVVEVEASAGTAAPEAKPTTTSAPPASVAEPVPSAGDADVRAEVLVIGSGPGGYTAAFRAADLGKQVILVERDETLGGVCLNVGCIPSKALLHVAEVIGEARALAKHGVDFGEPTLDFEKLRAHKDGVVGRLTGGLVQLAKQRKVGVVRGVARLVDAHAAVVETSEGPQRIAFDHVILAAGSEPVALPGLPDDPRIVDSTGALEIDPEVKSLLVVGGGIIGLEMATVYAALGCAVTVVEMLPQLMTGADPDLVRPLLRRIQKQFAAIHLETRVTDVWAEDDGIHVRFEGAKAPDEASFDRVLVAVGRRPNGTTLGLDAAGVRVDERGFVPVDAEQRTGVPHIFAIGDLTPGPMLAHKATHEGKTAAEVIAGEPAAFDGDRIPSVAYTDPEVAWVGLTETAAKEQGIEVEIAHFPWAASGRALSVARNEGLTKLILEPKTRRLLGGGIVGPNAGELIGEIVLALEMGADAEDVALTIHPHPTLSETVGLTAEVATGSVTDILKR